MQLKEMLQACANPEPEHTTTETRREPGPLSACTIRTPVSSLTGFKRKASEPLDPPKAPVHFIKREQVEVIDLTDD